MLCSIIRYCPSDVLQDFSDIVVMRYIGLCRCYGSIEVFVRVVIVAPICEALSSQPNSLGKLIGV